MKRKILLIVTTLLAGAATVSAQSGRVINAPYFDISQRVLFSQTDYTFGTSRTAAMGGAFTSLGADLSSMNINPAGLGMYQSSDWGITQGLSIASMSTSSPRMAAGSLSSGGNRTTYGLDNIAIVYNSYSKSRGLTSLSFGFGYNRMANFNSRSYVQTHGENNSIADIFCHQLAALGSAGIGPGDLAASADPFNNWDIYLDNWGAVLGYQSGLVTHSGGSYDPAPEQTATNSYIQSITKGGIYEYTLSLGANFNNIVYFGASLGLTQVLYKEFLTYEETYDTPGLNNPSMMWYDQNTNISGVGYTLKLGVTLRPVEPFRIGVAFHLPTYYMLDKTFKGEMEATRRANTGKFEDEQRFNTPPKFLAGASVVIAQRAILAVDYECTWYNKIRTRSTDMQEEENSQAESGQLLKPGHSVRAGLEILATDWLSLRAGAGYHANIMREKSLYDSGETLWPGHTPTAYSSYNLSAGLGFNLGRNMYIDMAYIFRHSNYANNDYYFLKLENDFVGQYDPSGDVNIAREYTPKKNYHLVSLTIGSRF